MRVVLADEHPMHRDEVRRILLGEGLTCEADDVVDFEHLPGRLAETDAQLVVVVCGAAVDACVDAIRMAYNVTGAPILAAGVTPDSDAVRRVMRAGAREYLDLARLREELSESLIKIEADGQLPSERGNLIAMFSPSGGVGLSTTSINLAARLAGGMPNQVALVDLQPAPSDMSLLLDLEPRYTLDDVCRYRDRLDQKLLAGAMMPHASGVHVLAQAGYPAGGGLPETSLDRYAVRQVLTLARRMYRTTVVDLDHMLDAVGIEAMRLATFIGLVARPDVPGLRRARWALDTLESQGLARDRFRLVLNRFGQRRQISVARAEEMLGIKVFQRIPDDHATVNRAVNEGITVANISKLSRISRSFSSFARNVQPK